MIEFGHLSHSGLCRSLNEDTYYGDATLGLWLIADGMGGHGHGEIASALARDAIVRQVRTGASLEAAIRQADADLLATARLRKNLSLPMGTTVVCARVHQTDFELAWVGDSRAYLWHSGRLSQLTQDTSYVQDLISKGIIAPDQAHLPSHRLVVNQALGVTDASHLNVASFKAPWKAGMQLLLCSDGLSDQLTPSQIAVILSAQDCSAQESVDTLVAAALDAGGADNITAQLIRAR